MTDLVGKRVRAVNPADCVKEFKGKVGIVSRAILVLVTDDRPTYVVDLDSGERAWLYDHELEVLDASHPSA